MLRPPGKDLSQKHLMKDTDGDHFTLPARFDPGLDSPDYRTRNMTAPTWIHKAIGEDRLRQASADARQRRLAEASGLPARAIDDENLEFVSRALELGVFSALQDDDRKDDLRTLAAETFGIVRTLAWPEDNTARGEWLVRLGCFAVLGDRAVEFRQILLEHELTTISGDSDDWGAEVWSTVLHVWLLLFREDGRKDLGAVKERIAYIRSAQRRLEPGLLQKAKARKDVKPAWELISRYHLAKAAEVLAECIDHGCVDVDVDIREQLEAQFELGIRAAARGRLVEQETLTRLLARTADAMVISGIRTREP